MQLKQLDEELLILLNSEENLLEKDKIMSKLEEIKKTHDINEKISKFDETTKRLNDTMNEYKPISKMESRIFFALDSLFNKLFIIGQFFQLLV